MNVYFNMATGAIFSLITNDGRQDRLLMATTLLSSRLKQIQSVRAQNPTISDPTPTLADIEKTHIIFMNAHFKPFAAVAYEYNKVAVSSGEALLGNDIQFAIPQFGDFFHDMVLHISLKQPTLISTAVKAGNEPAMRWCHYPGERIIKKCQFEVNGNPLDEYTSDLMNFHREFHVPPNKLTGWKRCVGQEMPNEGFEDQPNWVSNGVSASSLTHRFTKTMYNGSQTPTGQKDLASTGNLEMFIPLLFWCNTDPRLSIPSVSIPYGQRFINITLAEQEELVNYYPRGEGSYSEPQGSVVNTVNLIDTIELYINNIFVNPEVHDVFIKRIGFQLIRVHRRQTHSASKDADSVLLQQLKWPIETMYVGMRVKDYSSETATLQAEHMDKWHMFSQVDSTTSYAESGWETEQKQALNGTSVSITPSGGVLTGTVTFAASTAVTGSGTLFDTETSPGDILLVIDFAGDLHYVEVANAPGATNMTLTAVFPGTIGDAKSVVNITIRSQSTVAGTGTEFDTELSAGDTLVVDGIPYKVLSADAALSAVIDGAVNVTSTASFSKLVKMEKTHTVYKCNPTLDTITLKVHGINIYNSFPANFFNSYIPFHYGGPNVSTPTDCGVMMVTFNFYPGTYQPSGHINISRAREFYLNYTSSVIDGSKNGTLVVVAKAINFLLIADGSAVLRYST